MGDTVLQPCPFCGSEGQLHIERWENPNGYAYGSGQYAYVLCKVCNARGGFSLISNFNDFTKYTLKDFQENHLIRVQEDDKYKTYVENQQKAAVDAWNRRINAT